MQQPLAFLLRPTTIAEIIGQSHIINDQNGLISRMLKYNYASSLIFYGDPGVGKSSIDRALANDLQLEYAVFNAEIDKKQDLENIIKKAQNVERFIIIVEEVHRMNKDRQDILLQYLENGHLIMFACTTENPYFVMKLKNHTANEVVEKFKDIVISNNLFGKIKGIITDRGKEFSKWRELEIFAETQVYFCDPGKPQQKPLIEYMNSELRQWFPKGTDFNNVSQQKINWVVNVINDKLRPVLNWKTAKEVFSDNFK